MFGSVGRTIARIGEANTYFKESAAHNMEAGARERALAGGVAHIGAELQAIAQLFEQLGQEVDVMTAAGSAALSLHMEGLELLEAAAGTGQEGARIGGLIAEAHAVSGQYGADGDPGGVLGEMQQANEIAAALPKGAQNLHAHIDEWRQGFETGAEGLESLSFLETHLTWGLSQYVRQLRG